MPKSLLFNRLAAMASPRQFNRWGVNLKSIVPLQVTVLFQAVLIGLFSCATLCAGQIEVDQDETGQGGQENVGTEETRSSNTEASNRRDEQTPPGPEPTVEYDRSILDSVRDKTLGIPPEESDAYYQLLYTVAHENAQAAMSRAREFWNNRRESHPDLQQFDHPHFADIFKHPEDYRGQIITQTGFVRRIVSYDAGKNDFGIERLYEAWIYPETGQSNPIVVVFSVPPRDGIRVGDDLDIHVGVTGYFLKLYGYRAQDTTRLAPMILAAGLEPLPLSINPTFLEQRIHFFIISTVVVVLLMGYILYTGLKRKRTSPVQSSLPDEFPGLESPPPSDDPE